MRVGKEAYLKIVSFFISNVKERYKIIIPLMWYVILSLELHPHSRAAPLLVL